MSTYVSDANATNLLPADLATDQTSTGTITQVDWPREVLFRLVTGTVSGINKVVIQGSDVAAFTGTSIQTLFTFDLIATDDDVTFEGRTFVPTKYIRTSVIIGTGGDMTGSTLKMHPVRYKWSRADSAAKLV